MGILNAINDRHQEQKAGDVEDEWQYLERTIFDAQRIDSCALYQYVFEEWQVALKSLLTEFSSLFFFESVKDSVDLKMQSLFDNCDR